MTAGRKVIPISIKQAKGTHRPHRDRKTYTPSSRRPIPPSWLNKRASAIFRHMTRRLGEVGQASATHTEALALLSCHMEEVERFHKILNESVDAQGKPQNGYVYATANSFGDPVLKEHPAVRLYEKASLRVHSLLTEFGLTPAAAQKVGTRKPAKEKNEFDDF